MNTMQRIAPHRKLDVGSHFFIIYFQAGYCTVYIDSMCVDILCKCTLYITTDTQVFVYNFIFHVFRILCFFFFLPLLNFSSPRAICLCLHFERTKKQHKSYCAHRCKDCETNIMIFVERCYKNNKKTNIENQNEIVFISSLLPPHN